jgi:hypothetical protein
VAQHGAQFTCSSGRVIVLQWLLSSGRVYFDDPLLQCNLLLTYVRVVSTSLQRLRCNTSPLIAVSQTFMPAS